MILRRVDHLSPGMVIRIKVPEHKRSIERQVQSVEKLSFDHQRLVVRFHQKKGDPMPLGFNFFPDDLVEYVL